jgi:hypothetical protein
LSIDHGGERERERYRATSSLSFIVSPELCLSGLVLPVVPLSLALHNEGTIMKRDSLPAQKKKKKIIKKVKGDV